MKTVTARCAARHGVPKHATLVSPYSGRRLTIIAARFAGYQVQLIPEIGNPFCVDPADRLDVAR
jgi:hypothetical protein